MKAGDLRGLALVGLVAALVAVGPSCKRKSSSRSGGGNIFPQVTVGAITGTQSDLVDIPYDLVDANGDSVTIVAEFSTNGGAGFATATSGPGGDGTGPFQAAPLPMSLIFQWDSLADLGPISTTARIRITPSDSLGGVAGESADFLVDNTPSMGAFLPGPDMSIARMDHTATLLVDGRVLIAGGTGPGSVVLDSAEIYDPTGQVFTPLPVTMTSPRSRHTATRLSGGDVLITGGETAPGAKVKSTEIFDTIAETFGASGDLTHARAGHAATGNATGAFVSGGTLSALPVVLLEVDAYDEVSGTFGLPGLADEERELHTSDLLPNDSILLFAGSGLAGISTEEYDPVAGTSTNILESPSYPEISMHASSPLQDGTVLVTGGGPGRGISSIATSYDCAFVYTQGVGLAPVSVLITARKYHTASLLQSGEVLVAGGQINFSPASMVESEIYEPVGQTFRSATSMNVARAKHTAVVLGDGTVLVTGGTLGGNAPVASSEIFVP